MNIEASKIAIFCISEKIRTRIKAAQKTATYKGTKIGIRLKNKVFQNFYFREKQLQKPAILMQNEED